ncbi:hypothetical protein Dsin_009331 [Dipteronia sinensis]|uniref:Reverse transcriptase domain-containing protein n=1 Tax=Dipteronia sinensis TaxID=43782 RepID=A0AAE0EBM9_9ROSI|nr:hypothetical protein Dsin_009331 [Dipteronia sinensis]
MGGSLEVVNDTLIVIIPKVKKVVSITEYQPITLCNVVYKILAKALTNCLRLVLREKQKVGALAMKLDMSKAYGQVEWSLLFSNATTTNCATIRRILEEYAAASGQVITFDKSAVCMSKSVRHVDGWGLANIISVKLVQCHERLIKTPTTLASRVIKDSYFPDVPFLEAGPCTNGSLIWKGLLWDSGILEAGSRWRVGSGSSIQIYGARWVSRHSSFKFFSLSSLPLSATVDMLKLPTEQWNAPLIKLGLYSVRSGYQVGKSMELIPSTSGPSGLVSWWKKGYPGLRIVRVSVPFMEGLRFSASENIMEILDVMITCLNPHILFASKKSNLVAHSLAKMALSNNEDMFWLESVPPCVEMLVLADASG